MDKKIIEQEQTQNSDENLSLQLIEEICAVSNSAGAHAEEEQG